LRALHGVQVAVRVVVVNDLAARIREVGHLSGGKVKGLFAEVIEFV